MFHFETSTPTETAGLYYNKLCPAAVCVFKRMATGEAYEVLRGGCASLNVDVCACVQ